MLMFIVFNHPFKKFHNVLCDTCTIWQKRILELSLEVYHIIALPQAVN